MIEFKCPECNRVLKVKLELAGRTGKCPGCGNKICVPENSPLANELPGDLFPDLSAAITTSDFPSMHAGGVPTRETATELVLMPTRSHIFAIFVVGVSCIITAIFFYSDEPSLPAVALSLLLVGIFMIGFGIYACATYAPLLTLTRDGLYYSLVKKTVPWRDIQEAYYWNSNQDLSAAARFVAASLTKNRMGTTFIKVRFTPEGRKRHKRLVHWTVDFTAFADDDMVIPMSALRIQDLKSIDIPDEINKRARAH